MKTYVLHHNDPDGFGAAYSAWLKLGRDNVEYIAVDYGQPMPELINGSNVFVLDFSYSRPVLDELVSRMNFVLIIDHHKSAYEALHDHPNAIFDMTKSGAGLAWDYFHPNKLRPEFIDYIEDADLWAFKLIESRYVKNSLYIIELNLDAFIEAAKVPITTRITEGKVLAAQIEHMIDMGYANAHTVQVDEFKMLCVNVCVLMSEFGSYLFRQKLQEHGADFAGVYYRLNQDNVKFSCRSTGDFDVSVIAKRFGGGGHKNAAGFEVPVEKFNWRELKSSN